MYCQNCGKELQEGEVCNCQNNATSMDIQNQVQETPPMAEQQAPEQPQQGQPSVPPQQAPWNGLAIAGFVVSLLSIFWNPALIISILGIILSSVGLKQINETGAQGKGFAIAGLVIGVVRLVITIIIMIVVAAAVTACVGTLGALM